MSATFYTVIVFDEDGKAGTEFPYDRYDYDIKRKVRSTLTLQQARQLRTRAAKQLPESVAKILATTVVDHFSSIPSTSAWVV